MHRQPHTTDCRCCADDDENVTGSSARRRQRTTRRGCTERRRRLTVDVFRCSFCLLLIAGALAAAADDLPDPEAATEQTRGNSTTISAILNQLVDPKAYDKRLRPNYGEQGKPVQVGITIHVTSISAVSEVEMDFTLDFYLRQYWKDPRLSYASFGVSQDLTVGYEYVERLWVPDTFFPNEKKSFFHQATTRNSFLRIKKTGDVMISQRLTVTATCHMKLHLFPLDSQKCTLEIESYGYSTDDIEYKWKGEQEQEAIGMNEFELPQFKVAEKRIEKVTSTTSTGQYSRLVCKFLFTRSIGFYMIQIYLPSILIVVISWVSFWLSRDATPARVSLGVTTVLTMTTLMTTTNSAMPKVSYVKSIDIYLGTCFLMVFASLLEYAAVGYLNKKRKNWVEKNKIHRQRVTKPVVQVTQPQPMPQAQELPFGNLSPMTPIRAAPIMAKATVGGGLLSLQRLQSAATPGFMKRNNNMYPLTFENDPMSLRPMMPPPESPLISNSGPATFQNIECDCDFTEDGYATNEITYDFKNTKEKNDSVKLAKVARTSLPQFHVKAFCTERAVSETSTGFYVRLKIHILFVRSSGFYMMNIFIPSILIVIISWVSFWLSREAAPARVALGVTTVLTMTTLTTTTNATMPKVSYVKAIDYFLGFCFVMVFASLLEYALVSYLNKKLTMRKEKKRQKQKQKIEQPVEFSMFSPSLTPDRLAAEDAMSVRYRGLQARTATASTTLDSGHHQPLSPIGLQQSASGGYPQPLGLVGSGGSLQNRPTMIANDSAALLRRDPHLECDCDIQSPHHSHAQVALMPINVPKARRRRRGRPFATIGVPSPSIIDKYSRIAFPLIFILFNAFYWVVLKIMSSASQVVDRTNMTFCEDDFDK